MIKLRETPVIPRCELPTTIPVRRSLLSRSNLRKIVYDKVQVNIYIYIYIQYIYRYMLYRASKGSIHTSANFQWPTHAGCIRFFKSSPWPITIHTATTQLVHLIGFHPSKRSCGDTLVPPLFLCAAAIYFFFTLRNQPKRMHGLYRLTDGSPFSHRTWATTRRKNQKKRTSLLSMRAKGSLLL